MRRVFVRGAALGAAACAYFSKIRPWHLRYGATDEEVARLLPGDELIPDAKIEATRAISVRARPDDVWPWVVQLGQDRGGFYTYDWLENVFALGIHSTDRILHEWQHRDVGDFVRGGAWGSSGWYVMEIEPPRVLVLQAGDERRGRPARPDDPPVGTFTWSFVAEDSAEGETRLIVRARWGFTNSLARPLVEVFESANFVMTQRMLRGIKDRGERTAACRRAVELEGTAA